MRALHSTAKSGQVGTGEVDFGGHQALSGSEPRGGSVAVTHPVTPAKPFIAALRLPTRISTTRYMLKCPAGVGRHQSPYPVADRHSSALVVPAIAQRADEGRSAGSRRGSRCARRDRRAGDRRGEQDGEQLLHLDLLRSICGGPTPPVSRAWTGGLNRG